jgi:hypothetical protein
MQDCLQVGTFSTSALMKMTGKTGILGLLTDLEFQEITCPPVEIQQGIIPRLVVMLNHHRTPPRVLPP